MVYFTVIASYMRLEAMARSFITVCCIFYFARITEASMEGSSMVSETAGWKTIPVLKSVPVGASFNLSCQLTGDGTVVWTLNSQPLGFGDVLFQSKSHERYSLNEIERGSVLSVVSAQREDSGEYKCQSTDVHDISHMVNILDPPELNVTCRGKIGLLRWRISHQNEVSETEQIVTIQRSRRSPDKWETIKEVNSNNTEVKVQLITRDQKYRILWVDSLGIEWPSNESPLTTCTAPQDVPLSNPTDIQASLLQQEDGQAELTIYWTGIPEDDYMGDDVHYNLQYKEWDSDVWHTETISNSAVYYKYKTLVQPDDEEVRYIVQVQSVNNIGLSRAPLSPVAVGLSLSAENTTSDYPLPKFISQSKLITAREGETVRLECEHEAKNDYAFVWFKNSSATPIAAMGYRISDDYRFIPEARALKIEDVQPGDGGTYVCTVQMSPVHTLEHVLIVGDTVPIATVTVTCSKDLPEATVTFDRCLGRLSSREERICRTKWACQYEYVPYCIENTDIEEHIRDQLVPYDYVVQVIAPLENSHTKLNTITIIQDLSVKIQLRPMIKYRFRVASRNIYGQSPFAEGDTSCTTVQGVPWRNPSHVVVSRTSESIIVFWKGLDSYERHGQNFIYKVTISSNNRTVTEKVDETRFEIEDVDKAAVYMITVVSSNDKGDCVVPPEEKISYPLKVQEEMENYFSSFYSSLKSEAHKSVVLGGQATLECQKTGNGSVTWRKLPERSTLVFGDVILLNPSRMKLELSKGDLTITDIKQKDYGYYECITYEGNHVRSTVWVLANPE